MSQSPTAVGSSAEDLLLAADAARLSNHPEQAVGYLRRVTVEHAGDSRALRDTAKPAAALDGSPPAALFGGSLGTRWGVTQTWSVLLDTRLERGEQSLQLADVRWTLLSGFAGAGANASVGPLRLSAGLGLRAGCLALAASVRLPNEGQSFTAPWAGVAVPLRLAFDVGGFVSPFVGGEAGYVLAPVRGEVTDGSVLVEQRGPWLCGNVGVAVAL